MVLCMGSAGVTGIGIDATNYGVGYVDATARPISVAASSNMPIAVLTTGQVLKTYASIGGTPCWYFITGYEV